MNQIQPQGDIVPMIATNPKHFGAQLQAKKSGKSDDFVSEFSHALKNAFYKVNGLQQKSNELTKALAVRPDTVDIHDVTIAAEKAKLALMLTKSVVDRITQAYRELINLR